MNGFENLYGLEIDPSTQNQTGLGAMFGGGAQGEAMQGMNEEM